MAVKKRTPRREAPIRREEIVQWLKEVDGVTYEQIQRRFRVAPMTSRRDISALDAEGRVIKTLRGAMRVPSEGFLTEGPLHVRLRENTSAKRMIARAALDLIRPGNTLHLDGGTTCVELARAISQSQMQVTVVTNSVLVSACFCEGCPAKVIQIGGTLNTQNGCSTGAETEAVAKSYFIDVGFFTTRGYVPGEGTYESSEETFRVKLAFAEQCSNIVLLLDHTKFGKRALNLVLADSKITRIVTDRSIPKLADSRLIVAK